jgi:hypothetical protein
MGEEIGWLVGCKGQKIGNACMVEEEEWLVAKV